MEKEGVYIMWWAWITAGLILFLFILVSTKLSISIHILHEQGNNFAKVTVKAYRILSYTVEIPTLKIDKESASLIVEEETKTGRKQKITNEKEEKVTISDILHQFQKLKAYLQHIVGFHTIIKGFLEHVTIRRLEWYSAFGTGDAASTGVLTGVLWSFKGVVIGLMDRFTRLNVQPLLHVTPHFQQLCSRIEIRCMFSFRVWHAISAAFRVIKHWKSMDIGGNEHVRASDSRSNDDSDGKPERND